MEKLPILGNLAERISGFRGKLGAYIMAELVEFDNALDVDYGDEDDIEQTDN